LATTDGARRPAKRVWSLVRSIGLSLASVGAIYLFARVVGTHYPVKNWLFWTYLKIWGYVALFVAGSIGGGHLAMSTLGPRFVPLRERVVYTLATGVLVFYYLVFVGGLLHVLTGWFAVALPVVLALAGARGLFRDGRRVLRHVRARRANGVTPSSRLRIPITIFGAFGVGLVYYAILSPRNVAFDSSFYHLGIAQQYATEHAIRPFQEGWLPGALPHLASVLYAWAFVLPGLDMFGRIECAAHVEFALFVMTLLQIPTLVRYLAPRAGAAASWAAMFLFPGILVYDSSLTVAADHVAAFWTIPAWLAFRRAYRDPSPRNAALLAACLAGGILTKYQAMYVLAFPVLALIGKAAFSLAALGVRRIRKQGPVTRREILAPLAGLGAALVAGLVLTTPHWLKNLAFYGDPLFPYLNKVFTPTHWVPDTGRLLDDWSTSQSSKWVPTGTTSHKLWESAKAMFTFSFSPHDWPNFHGKVPIFGSLFTLSTALLPFLQRTRRVWALSAATHLGVFVWFWTMHQDRYLQVLVPWMAAVVAATISLAFRSGIPGRIVVSALVLFQVVWGLDAYLIPAHAMTRATPLTTTSDLISLGWKKKYDDRFKVPGALFEVGRSPLVPDDARILMHENNPRLGIWRPVVVDVAGWQFALRYELMDSPAAVDDAFHNLGITHILSRPQSSRGMDCLGADLRYFDYLNADTKQITRFGDMGFFELPKARPDPTPRTAVAYLGCNRLYERGLHELSSLSVRDKQVLKPPPRRPATKRLGTDVAEILADADFAVVDPKCKPGVDTSKLDAFVRIGTRGKEQLWARKRGHEEAAAPKDDAAPADDDDRLFDP